MGAAVPAHQKERWALGVLAALVAVSGAVLLFPRPMEEAGLTPVGLLFLALFLIAIPAHELGHGLAGALVGYRVRLIRLGIGPVILARRVRTTRLELCALPFGGLTIGVPKRPWASVRLREWTFYAAGPATNVIVSLVLYRLLWKDLGNGTLREFVATAAGVNVFEAAVNLIPARSSDGLRTDGYSLLTIPFRTRAEVEALQIAIESQIILDTLDGGHMTRALEAAQDLRRRAPHLASAAFPLSLVLLRQARYDEARGVLREALAQSNEPIQVARVQGQIALVSAMGGRVEDLPEADRFSADALEALPGIAGAKGIRGAVLVRLGRCAEAVPLLERALALSSGYFDRDAASLRVFLARALRGIGRHDEAERFAAAARRLDPEHPLLEWALSDTPPAVGDGAPTRAPADA
jgi:tetratricopeptide (TPR) repeat protein